MGVVSLVQNYEAVLVLKELSKEDKSKAFDFVYDTFSKKGSEVLGKEDWGVKDLFHPISKINRGDFNFFQFNIAGEHIKNIYSELKLNTDILKIFIAKVSRGK